MFDSQCVAFLQWALPKMGLRWRGYRGLRRQVCRRISTRIHQLGLADQQAYRAYLEQNPAEWQTLEGLCVITISRLYRDRAVFDCLSHQILPEVAQRIGTGALNVWSAGCASGEEPYSVGLVWHMLLAQRFPSVELHVLGTDRDPQLLARAARGCYRASSLRELPPEWLKEAFQCTGEQWCLKQSARQGIRFELQDLRRGQPGGRFQLILCRNVAFTYFDEPEQRRVLNLLLEHLAPDGYLVIGCHERLPQGKPTLELVTGTHCIYSPAFPLDPRRQARN